MIYEFKCEKCNVTEEKILSLSEYERIKRNNFEEIKCPICKKPMVKTVTKSMIILKGCGWSDMNYGITEREMESNRNEDKRLIKENNLEDMIDD